MPELLTSRSRMAREISAVAHPVQNDVAELHFARKESSSQIPGEWNGVPIDLVVWYINIIMVIIKL